MRNELGVAKKSKPVKAKQVGNSAKTSQAKNLAKTIQATETTQLQDLTLIKGNQGEQGASGAIVPPSCSSFELTVTVTGDQVITLPAKAASWYALFVNGLRQPNSTFTVSGQDLTIPAELVWLGAICVFDYLHQD